MKVPFHVVQARRERLAAMLAQHGYMPVGELCRRLEVSEATARRDLAALEGEKKIKRTYGGAVSEFENRFPSYTERIEASRGAKLQIASAAASYLTPGLTVFLDSGTTVYAIADAFRARPATPITVVTCNLPVGEMLATLPGVGVYLLAGQLLARQATLLGEAAVKSLGFWRFDVAFLSAEGMDAEGLWNSQPLVVQQQKAVIARSNRSVFCIARSKLKRQAAHFLLPWTSVDTVLTDATAAEIRAAGISLEARQYWNAKGGKAACPLPSPQNESNDGVLPVELL